MIAEARARLAAAVTSLKSVKGAAELAKVLEKNPPKNQQPAAFVAWLRDSAAPNSIATGGFRQQTTLRFGVYLAIGDLTDPRGQAASDRVEIVKDEVIAVYAGWEPTSVTGQVDYAGGRMIGLRDGVVWVQLDFQVTDHIRNA